MNTSAQAEFRDSIPFLGGRLWIDFLNTTPMIDGQFVDVIESPAGLRHWASLAGIAAPDVAGIGDVGRVVALRAMLREGFDALATGRPLATELLAEINALIGQVRVALTVEMTSASRTGAQLVTRETIAQDPVAVAVALDFARFVTDAEPDRLHHCANEECVVVFHDHGKNKTRRWCSMAGCGNRHKVARHRKRQRQSE